MKKFICFVLAFMLAFGTVPAEAKASEKITEIKDDMMQQALYLIPEGFSEKELFGSGASTTPETVTVEEATARLEDFIAKFEGKFFTADGTYCDAGNVHAVECDNCLMSNVIKAEWVEELVGMGELNASLCPTQYSYNGKQGSADGWQCFGFANFAHWYIFAGKNTDKVTSTFEASGPMTYDTIKNALPGDVLRSNYYGGHSMVFISCDENGFTVIDSNFSIKYACEVKVHTMKYNSSYSVAISGTTNYDRRNEEECEPISLRYDDRYDVSGKTVEIIDAGSPTSKKVGYGVAEGTPDDAVITFSGEKLIATGIGTAKVKIDGVLYEITVEAAPISLFMITGHSMGAGQNGSKTESVVGEEGKVYSSHGTANLSTNTAGVGISYAAESKAKNIYAFTKSGGGTIGEGSAFAWKWNSLTGEKVWVLNTAVGGSNLKEWIPGTTNYKNAVSQFKRAQAILSNEIAAGHYVLSDMGIFYHNGANFGYKSVTFTQEDLKNWYDSMWGGFKSEFSKDIDGDGKSESVSFLGIIPIWTKSGGVSYTQDEPAGLYMAASKEYSDIFTVSVIGQEWLTDANVSALFPEIDYEIQSGAVLKRPAKTSEVFASDNVHYQQVAYNAVGIDIADNLYEYLYGKNELSEVKLVYSKDLTEIANNTELEYGEELIIVPITEPIAYSKLEFKAEGNIEISYPLAVKMTANGTGKIVVSADGKKVKELTFVCNTAPHICEHQYSDEITPPTCTEHGYTTYTCTICGESYVDSYVDATGHSYENGICTICGKWEYPLGDLNLDGDVNVMDAYYARLVAAKLVVPTEQQILLGDVDLDGKITAVDASYIRKFSANIIQKFPSEQ